MFPVEIGALSSTEQPRKDQLEQFIGCYYNLKVIFTHFYFSF